MKIALLAFIVALVLGAGYFFRLDRKILSFLSAARRQPETISLSSSTESPVPLSATPSGQVAGVSTEKLQALGHTLLQTGAVLGKTVSTVVLEQSNSPEANKIQVEQIATQISKQFETLPTTLLNQAKVAYCQQVLIEATKSANSQ